MSEPAAPAAEPEPPAPKPKPAAAPPPQPQPPKRTRWIAPAAADEPVTSSLPEVKVEPQAGKRYRTNFARKRPALPPTGRLN